ncbi:hypothetical protein [Sinorhizobium meliloti]|uniref:hypothetical protein n=1 Tax=Rhizobium meliloti TaxID=382 RepID=UPI003DA1BC95
MAAVVGGVGTPLNEQLWKYEKGANRVSASALVLIYKELGITPNHILGAFFDNDEDTAPSTYASDRHARPQAAGHLT